MSRIKNAFVNKTAFIGFLVAGDPSMEQSREYILTMAKAGADLIEIGIPFSDPVAEGVTIEAANIRALSAGATTEKIFELVRSVRKEIEIPLLFLTYVNPVLNYGYERFFGDCKESGIDGIIIPDLPYEEKGELSAYAAANDVNVISLIAPTSGERTVQIAKDASGFIYLVSSMGVTGVRSEINAGLQATVQKIKAVTDVPVAVGFGIHTPKQAADISDFADGVIVGSAIVKIIEQYGFEAHTPVFEYVKRIKEAIG